MFLETERLMEKRRVTEAANKGTEVDNKVLSALAHEYSLMDQHHARIRAEALASHISGRGGSTPPSNRTFGDLTLVNH